MRCFEEMRIVPTEGNIWVVMVAKNNLGRR